ncbi:unnamed protein product [Amoebophrya sp. A120]|nr:unnamed protein product [Amoebophrya sp. A120]|eukprot:GSA120T00015832001.1
MFVGRPPACPAPTEIAPVVAAVVLPGGRARGRVLLIEHGAAAPARPAVFSVSWRGCPVSVAAWFIVLRALAAGFFPAPSEWKVGARPLLGLSRVLLASWLAKKFVSQVAQPVRSSPPTVGGLS